VGDVIALKGRLLRIVAFRSRTWAAVERVDRVQPFDVVAYLARCADLAGGLRIIKK
jgi:hypothetical protein